MKFSKEESLCLRTKLKFYIMVSSSCDLVMAGASLGENRKHEEQLVWREELTAALI